MTLPLVERCSVLGLTGIALSLSGGTEQIAAAGCIRHTLTGVILGLPPPLLMRFYSGRAA